MSSFGVSSLTLSSNKMGDNNNASSENLGSQVKIVTIAGKEVEVKYETLKKKYDIFGLHVKQRRAGNRKSRISEKSNTYSMSDATKKNTIANNGQQVESFSTSNNSKETSVGSTKLKRIFKRFESSDDRSSNKLPIDKITNNMKKEPVKMENRFDMLLSSSNGDDLKAYDHINSNAIVKSSAKKKKKKSSVHNTIVNVSFHDNKSNKDAHFDDCEQLIAQKKIILANNNNVYHIRSNDEVFQTNNNHNQENRDEKQNVYKEEALRFNNSFVRVNDQRVDEISQEDARRNERQVKSGQQSIADKKVTKSENLKAKPQNGLIVKPSIGLKADSVNNYDINKSRVGVRDQNEKSRQQFKNESSLNRNLLRLIINWLFITLLVVAFLVIYSLVILNQFCDCNIG